MRARERLSDNDAIQVLASRRAGAAAPEHHANIAVILRASEGLAVVVVAVAAYMALKTHVSWKAFTALSV